MIEDGYTEARDPLKQVTHLTAAEECPGEGKRYINETHLYRLVFVTIYTHYHRVIKHLFPFICGTENKVAVYNMGGIHFKVNRHQAGRSKYLSISSSMPLTCRAGDGRSDVTRVWLK